MGKEQLSCRKNVSFLRHYGVTSSTSGCLMENPGGKDQRGQILHLCLFISLSLPVRWGRLNLNNCILLRKPFLKFWEFCFFSSNRKEQILQKFQWLVSDKINRKIFLSVKFRANTESNNKIENKDLYNKEVAIILSVKLSLKVQEEKKHESSEVEVSDNKCDAADESGLIQQRKSGRNSSQEFPATENEDFDR